MRLWSVPDLLSWLFSEDLDRQKLTLLLLLTMAVYVIASHLVYRLGTGGQGGRAIVSLGRSWAGRLTGHILRLSFFVGIPLVVFYRGELLWEVGMPTTYAVAWNGDTLLRLLGVAEVQDTLRLGKAVGVGLVVSFLLIGTWVWFGRTGLMPSERDLAEPLFKAPWWEALREAVLAQLLWSLYRGIVALWVPDRVYVAFISLALISFTWLASPWPWHRLRTVEGAYSSVGCWMVALFTSLLWIVSDSLWLLILFHAVWIWASGAMLSHMAQAQRNVAPGRG